MTSTICLDRIKTLLSEIDKAIEDYALGDRPQSPPAWMLQTQQSLYSIYLHLRGIQ